MKTHRTWLLPCITLAFSLTLSGMAQAHPGHDGHETGSIGWGLAHPFMGLDHILAAVGIGVWAAMTKGARRLQILGGFGGGIIIGMIFGLVTGFFPQLEAVIAMSVILIGAGFIPSLQKRTLVFPIIATLAALFHGWAHGAETPTSGSAIEYLGGVLLGTTVLTALGFAVASLLVRIHKLALELTGGAMMVMGLAILLS